MGKLGQTLSQYWTKIQSSLFPHLEEELDSLTEKQKQLVAILEFVRIEHFIPDFFGCEGRPPKTRSAIARSLVAKTVFNIPSTRALWERLQSDNNFRRICGWENKWKIPSEATFSRAFAEFAATELPQKVHAAIIEKSYPGTDTIVIHNSRDSTAIKAREKPVVKVVANRETAPKKRGRPKRDEKIVKEPTRLQRQLTMTLEEMLIDLPKVCTIGSKQNSKGHAEHWIGYKLHVDYADGSVPISAILTSASTHDSQVAIPLATMTAARVTNLYDLMDSAYYMDEIAAHSRSLNHVPLIDKNVRRDKALAEELKAEAKRQEIINFLAPEKVRFRERTTAERGNARLKEEFGGRAVRVRGHAKVMCHLMFGILTLAADQLLKAVMVQ
jgi:hypothetical protein